MPTISMFYGILIKMFSTPRPMRITKVVPQDDFILLIEFDSGLAGDFDVKPYLEFEAFQPLKDISEFQQIKNGGYYVEWTCGADLSADTIEAHLKIKKPAAS